MKRSKWKGYYIHKSILSKKKDLNSKIVVWSRQSSIPESLIGKYIYIHNGKTFVKVFVNREKVGYKFGEFAITRRFTKKQKKINTNKKKI